MDLSKGKTSSEPHDLNEDIENLGVFSLFKSVEQVNLVNADCGVVIFIMNDWKSLLGGEKEKAPGEKFENAVYEIQTMSSILIGVIVFMAWGPLAFIIAKLLFELVIIQLQARDANRLTLRKIE